ncbi:MAG TPA: VIT1/CCC1 transporter family protein [Patescibacteria group bacterium]|nr:VIT1/CCC1 transporter family protein [Patescibacteria group bacterium]
MTKFPYRETIFGLEDSIVSTLGVVVGIAAGTDSRYVVVLSAIVVVVVESLSMTAGTYLSNKSQMELEFASGKRGFLNRRHLITKSVRDSFFMGASYVLGGVISVTPFFFIEPIKAIAPAIILSVASLFSIGYLKGKMAKINPVRSGLEMSLVSLTAALLGYLIGIFARNNLMRL